jgi:1-acyl-sn-glycerol-3-phosphate acyltransferase
MFPPDLPPVKNWPLYAYRVFAKLMSFFIFGLGSIFLIILFLPLLRLFLHPRERFKKQARRFVSGALNCFAVIMRIIGSAKREVKDKKVFRSFESKIIIANHPSLLDAAMLLSLIPNADCIVAGYLNRSILRGIVRQLYILSSLDFYDIMNKCGESLKQGNCLIVFPEGTRTPRSGNVHIRKDTARIAVSCGCNIVVLHIGGTDKFGLGKKDPWLGYNTREPYVYKIDVKCEIDIKKYLEHPKPAAVRLLTKDISAALFPEKYS